MTQINRFQASRLQDRQNPTRREQRQSQNRRRPRALFTTKTIWLLIGLSLAATASMITFFGGPSGEAGQWEAIVYSLQAVFPAMDGFVLSFLIVIGAGVLCGALLVLWRKRQRQQTRAPWLDRSGEA